MPDRHCFAPFCTSGYRNKKKVSLFKVPKNMLKVWSAAIPRKDKKVTITSVLCEEHFLAEDIIREVKTETYSYSLKVPRLRENAIPCIWPGCPSYLSKIPAKKRRIIKKTEYNHITAKRSKIQSKVFDKPSTSKGHQEEVGSTSLDINGLPANTPDILHKKTNEIAVVVRLQKQQQQEEEAERALHDLQEQETSGPSFNIKEEISIDESVLEEYLIPKLEPLENTSTDTTDGVDPLSLSYVQNQTSQETVSRCSSKTSTAVSPNIAEKNESANFMNIIPKLETFENTSVEENFIFSSPVQETTILRSTLKDNTNFSSTSSNASQSKKRKLSDEDGRVEDHDFPSVVQVKSENKEDYVDYAMYIADRLKNSNQSDSAIAMAKEKIELILCDLDNGVFENLISRSFSCNI